MADVPEKLHEQNLARIGASSGLANEHAVSFGKILDLGFEVNRYMVSLPQSLGARETFSRSGQQGSPIASTVGNT